MFQPNAGDSITIIDREYLFEPHPLTPRIPHGQEGRQAVVYKVTGDGGSWALKVFKPRYRRPYLVQVSKRIAVYASLPGMEACEREVMTPGKSLELLKANPDLAYAALMPWIDGPTWTEVVLAAAPLDVPTCLNLARSFLEVLVSLEENGLSHGDLSGVNIILPLLGGGKGVALVDLEQLYSPGAERPEVLPQSSPGYGFPKSGSASWGSLTDRYPGSVLIAEMLCFCDEKVVQAAWGESFFDPDELGKETERFQLLEETLRNLYGGDVASLFHRNWMVELIDDCSPFSEWMISLPETVGDSGRRKLAGDDVETLTPGPATPKQATATVPASLGPDQLLERAEACRLNGDGRGAEEIYRYVLQSCELPEEERRRITAALASLSEPAVTAEAAMSPPGKIEKAGTPAPSVSPEPVAHKAPAAERAYKVPPPPPPIAPPAQAVTARARRLTGRVLAAIIAGVVILLGGGAVLVVLLLSPSKVTVPQLEGIQITEARTLAEQEGLTLSEERVSLAEQDQGVVVSQDPAPGQALEKGAAVTVEVNAGSQASVAPTTSTDISSEATIAASSTLQPVGSGTSYATANLVDGASETCWAEGNTGYGIGDWVKYTFLKEVSVTKVSCLPGYLKVSDGVDRWLQNGRLKTVTISFDDGTRIAHTFTDDKSYQDVTVDPPEKTRTVTITIVDIYPGQSGSNWSASEDTTVSEMHIWGY